MSEGVFSVSQTADLVCRKSSYIMYICHNILNTSNVKPTIFKDHLLSFSH
jgi:hypothetical protein